MVYVHIELFKYMFGCVAVGFFVGRVFVGLFCVCVCMCVCECVLACVCLMS